MIQLRQSASGKKDNMKRDLNNAEETLLIPLCGRAQVSREHNSLLNDAKALEIIGEID